MQSLWNMEQTSETVQSDNKLRHHKTHHTHRHTHRHTRQFYFCSPPNNKLAMNNNWQIQHAGWIEYLVGEQDRTRLWLYIYDKKHRFNSSTPTMNTNRHGSGWIHAIYPYMGKFPYSSATYNTTTATRVSVPWEITLI